MKRTPEQQIALHEEKLRAAKARLARARDPRIELVECTQDNLDLLRKHMTENELHATVECQMALARLREGWIEEATRG